MREQEGAAASTVRRRLSALSSLFKHLVRHGSAGRNPVVDVAQMCTGARVKVPASSKTRPEEMVVPSPILLTAGVADSDNLSISKDRKSLIHKKAGWTWTFTPSVKP